MSLIPTAGRYSNIPLDVYHGATEICPGPSISSSGLKLLDICPRKYWFQSPLNPNPVPRKTTTALNMGKAAHDRLGLGENWPGAYYVLQADFNARKTKEQADWHAERDAAIEAGKVVLTPEEMETVEAMAATLKAHSVADALFSEGEPEVTIAWQDKETEVWVRVRPDWLPHAMRIIPDYKTCADASPNAFRRSVDNYGYFQSAALYLEGLEQALDARPNAFLFCAQEKDPPHIVQLYQLDETARSWGASLNRRALRKFADCLSRDAWPGYGRDVELIELPPWRTRELEKQAEVGELEYGH